MKVIGQWPIHKRGEGVLIELEKQIEVIKVGKVLRDKEDGIIRAIIDDYGDWVSPALYSRGIKSIMEVIE